MVVIIMGIDPVNVNWMACIFFGIACLVAGVNFLGIDNKPPEKVMPGIAVIHMFVGIMLLFFVTPYSFLTTAMGNELFSMWVGTFWGFFGITWLIIAFSIFKGTDLKPLSYHGLYAGSICIFYAISSFAWGLPPLFAYTFSVIFWVAAFLFFCLFPALRGRLRFLRIVGGCLVAEAALAYIVIIAGMSVVM